MSSGIQIIDPEERFKISMDGAEIFLRRISSDALLAIERRHRNQKNRQRINDDILDYVVLDWNGVSSPLGDQDVPCTQENKERLPAAVKVRILAAAQNPRADDMVH